MPRPRRDRSLWRETKGALAGALIALVAGAAVSARATAGPAPRGEAADKSPTSALKPLAELRSSAPLAAQYCAAARDAIAEARYAQQAAQLEKLAKDAEERLALMGKRSAELKAWLAKREDFIAAATKHLVEIFGAMRPESASAQLVRLDISTAAAILSRLDVRAASAILNDMPPEKAARLTAVIAGSARKDGQDTP
jgi:flagellar motility protein MotE (MotC chaperone)